MAHCSSIFAWKIPGTEEPDRRHCLLQWPGQGNIIHWLAPPLFWCRRCSPTWTSGLTDSGEGIPKGRWGKRSLAAKDTWWRQNLGKIILGVPHPVTVCACKKWIGKFPGGPVVNTRCYFCCGSRFHPWLENWGHTSCTAWQKKKKNQECIYGWLSPFTIRLKLPHHC